MHRFIITERQKESCLLVKQKIWVSHQNHVFQAIQVLEVYKSPGYHLKILSLCGVNFHRGTM